MTLTRKELVEKIFHKWAEIGYPTADGAIQVVLDNIDSVVEIIGDYKDPSANCYCERGQIVLKPEFRKD